MSITRCLGKLQKSSLALPPKLKDGLLTTIKQFETDGMLPNAAAIAAVEDALEELRSERAEIEEQIDKQLPKAEAAPAASETPIANAPKATKPDSKNDIRMVRTELGAEGFWLSYGDETVEVSSIDRKSGLYKPKHKGGTAAGVAMKEAIAIEWAKKLLLDLAGGNTSATTRDPMLKRPKPDKVGVQPEGSHKEQGSAPEPITPPVIAEAIDQAPTVGVEKETARTKLLKEIEKAIAAAPEVELPSNYKKLSDPEKTAFYEKIPLIEFSVPGDGVFKVRNTTTNLEVFLKRVKSSPGFSETALKKAGKKAPVEPKTLQNSVETNSDGVVATTGNTNAEGDRKFYVTMVRDGRVARLAGPFNTEQEAKETVQSARQEAYRVDPASSFDAFGVSAITSKDHQPGTLNKALGIGGVPVVKNAESNGAQAPEFPMAEAVSSYNGISFQGDRRAKQDAADYEANIRQEVEAAEPFATTDKQRKVMANAENRLRADYLSQYRRVMVVRSGAYSAYVAGSSKINTKQVNDRNAALDRAQGVFTAWLKDNTGRIKTAVLNARSPDQLADEKNKADAKAKTKEAGNVSLIGKLLNFKTGDDLRFGSGVVVRVNKDREGYPLTITFKDASGAVLSDNKIDLADVLYKGDKTAFRKAVDEARALAPVAAPEASSKAQPTTEKSSAVAPAPASKTPILEQHAATINAVRNGTASVDEYRASFAAVESGEAALKAELMSMSKDSLARYLGAAFFYRYKSESKEVIAKAIYDSMLERYSLGKEYGSTGFVMVGANSSQNYEKKQRAALVALVNSQTQEDLDTTAKEVAAARAEFKLKQEAIAESITNPKTLEDFRAVLRSHVGEGKTRKEALLMMTPEQRVKYDELEAEGTRSEREERKKALKPAIKTAGQKVDAQIIATKHTQKGHDLFVVRMAERVSREDYEKLNSSAKQMGGNYSSFRGNGAVPGFQFRDNPTAEAFVKLVNGDASDAQGIAEQRRDAFEDDRGQSVVERLRTMADKLTENAEEIENADRKTNTARRARFASGALRMAAEGKAKAQTMRNIAGAIEGGTAKFLDEVRTKTQVDMLSELVKTAKNNELRAKYQSYADQEKRAGEPPTSETADYSEFPTFTAYRSDIASLGRQLLEVDGTKKLGQQIMKVADDVTDAYIEFAKANILKVRTFSKVSDASVPTFPTADAADKAIKSSGYKGKAIAMQIKRGQYTVILSPSEAMSRGIWKGDADKRITFTAEFGKELVDAIGRRGNKQNRLTVPWQFQNAYDRLKLLARIGIETASEYRSALREFITLKKEAVADKVKEMELAMVGRKADGLDFFPTPAEIADQMVEAAEITPDMAVLEPSAGMGHLADRIRAAGAEPDVIEVSADRRELLQEKGYHLAEVNDFMNMEPRKFYTYGDVFRAPDGTEGVMQGYTSNRVALLQIKEDGSLDQRRGQYYNREELVGIGHRGSWSGYDRIIMNPPFSNRRDAEHVRHAYELLKPGGRIVAIMGEGVFFGSDKKAVEFRQWLDEVGGTDEKLPPGSFLDPSLPVNTAVNARMVVIEKPLKTKFSKAEKSAKPSTGMDRTALSAAIAPIIDKWNTSIAPEVVVVQSTKDLPQSVRDAKGFDASVEAAISGNRIYLVADRFSSVARAQAVLAHEAIGHYGIEAILGKDGFAQVAAQVIALRESGAMKQLFAEIDSRYGKLDDLTFASEAIAVMAEKGIKNTVMGRVMAAIRKFLRDLGFDLQLSETDLRAMIAEAARFLQKGDARAPKNAVAQFSKSDSEQDLSDVAYAEEIPFDAAMWADLTANLRKESPEEAKKQWEAKGTDSEFFKRWFGESKAVTRSGKPIKLYHGTSGNFFAFTRADGTSSGQTASGLGIFTTTQRETAELYGDRVIDLYAKIEKPYRMGQQESQSFADVDQAILRREALQRLGYDGIYMTHMDAWVAFDPKQLKSSTANRGTFAASNPDIRFSKMNPGAAFDSVANGIDRAVKGMPLKTAKEWASNKFEDWRPAHLALFTMRQLSEMFKSYAPKVETYVDQVTDLNTRRNVLRSETAPTAQKWEQMQRADKVNGRKMNELMHDSTLAGVDGAEAFKPMIVTLSNGEAVAVNALSVPAAIKRINALKEGAPDAKVSLLNKDIANLRAMLKLEPDRKAAHPALKARFDALPEPFRKLYVEVRDAHDKRSEQYLTAILARVGALDVDAKTKTELMFRMRANFENNKVQGPYFPLARFGDYTVAAEKPDGEGGMDRVFAMRETLGEQTAVANELIAQGYTIKRGRKIENARAIDGASGTFVAEVVELMAKNGVASSVQDDIYQLYLRSLPDLSTRKNNIHRKGTRGYSEDALRAFAGNMDHGAYQLARLEHTHKLESTLRIMLADANNLKSDPELGNKSLALYGEMQKRHEFVMNPKNAWWVNAASSANFVFYLGISPAAALVNLTQNALMTYPTLAAKYGFAKSAKMLFGTASKAALLMSKSGAKWAGSVITGKPVAEGGEYADTLTGEDAAAYKALVDMGAIDVTLAHDQAGISDGSTDEYNWKTRKAMRMVSAFFHAAEVVNRESAGIAAFRLAREAGPNQMNFQDAVKYAAEIINTTHFDYSNTNRARFMQGDWPKIFLAFKQYSQNTTFFLWRSFYKGVWNSKDFTKQEKNEARKQLAGVLGMSTLFSGVIGLPLMSSVFGIANAMAAMFGDDDEPWDAEVEFKNFLQDYLGGGFLSNAAQRGVIESGIDAVGLPAPGIAERVKLDQLWIRDADQELTAQERYIYLVKTGLGPIAGMAEAGFKAAGLFGEGQIWRGVETAIPKAVRDVMKTARYATEGVQTLRGDPLIENPGIGAAVLQGLGFAPAEVNTIYDRSNAYRNYEEAIAKRRDDLLDGYALMINQGDQEGIEAFIAKITAFNSKHPSASINARSLRQSMMARARYTAQFQDGIRLNPKLAVETKERVRF